MINKTDDGPPPLPPYSGPAGRAFQSYVRWLKNESYHQRGHYCCDEACRVCAAWRNINSAREETRPVAIVARGFERGQQIALDAMVAIAAEPTPYLCSANASRQFDGALRQGFRTTLLRHRLVPFTQSEWYQTPQL